MHGDVAGESMNVPGYTGSSLCIYRLYKGAICIEGLTTRFVNIIQRGTLNCVTYSQQGELNSDNVNWYTRAW